LLSCGRWNVGFTRSASTAARPLRSRVRDSGVGLVILNYGRQVQDPGGAFGQADNAIGVARARLAAVLHAHTLCSALSNVNGTGIFAPFFMLFAR
jgi:hypothetical protein